LTDDGPIYQALSGHLYRAKLITRFDDRYAVAKFSKSEVYDKVPAASALIFGDNRAQNFTTDSVARVQRIAINMAILAVVRYNKINNPANQHVGGR